MNASILIVDDEPANIFLLENLLSEYHVTSASNGEEMWASIDAASPSVIILDVMMPGKTGFQLAAELSANLQHRDIPIIFLTARTEPRDVVEGFDLGGFDYIKKPFNEDELLARVRSAVRRSEEKERLSRDIFIDPQTGLFNRRYLAAYIKSETGKAKRGLAAFSLAMLDIDFFKKINDTYGHSCGDFVLTEFSTVIKNSLRDYDLAVRYGGEEFLIVFPSADRDAAASVLERLRKIQAEHKYIHEGRTVAFTFTAGIADTRETGVSDNLFDDLIKLADQRLYRGKESSRDRIISDDE